MLAPTLQSDDERDRPRKIESFHWFSFHERQKSAVDIGRTEETFKIGECRKDEISRVFRCLSGRAFADSGGLGICNHLEVYAGFSTSTGENGMPKTASQFIVAAPTERTGEFTAVKERFSAYLSAHFPVYDFIIVDHAPIESDDFQVYPILGKADGAADPDGGFPMLAPPEPQVLDEIRIACRQFDVSGRRLS